MYRAEDTVSGRITATLPFPAEATLWRPVMAEKSLVNDVTESEPEPLPPDPEVVVVVDDELLLLQAVAMSPPTSNIVTSALLLLSLKVIPPG